VVNATGIVLHTGLGRAVMPPAVAESLASLTGCCNIQMDLETGDRVKREHGIRDLVCELTGAEDALLVNNNAAATLLVLKALAEGKEVVVSRGELIEIGGSFRLPDIMSQSGAKLREVGATNKTHARDYAAAICSETALLLKVHKSNYEIVGFSKEVSISEIAKLGREHQVPVVDDLGCGALVDLECFGLEHEMTVAESLDAGADLALFSTDKLIGGPQGGLIVGRADLLDRIRKHPLYRAFRVGKMTLAALEATLRIFRAPDLLPQQHPVYTMLAKTLGQIEAQATRVAETIAATHPTWDLSVEKTSARLGGGALPSSELPSFAVQITTPSHSADELALLLRRAEVPVIPRIQKTTLLLDMRTVSNADIEDVVAACGTIKE
ncbi:MAG: L-seryl-tRNA(Sec) selenium transferase, partial [Verrucomicrobia bacterium]|nr:L-seryl-tRNA(Sec) selenium transferase [Verrucomicrobiota bacterium]